MTVLKPLGNVALATDLVRLERFKREHIEPLRAACAQDPDIWEIYPVCMMGAHFDRAVAHMMSMTDRPLFAVIHQPSGEVVGMSSYINLSKDGVVEIGGTYIAPSVRGTGFNGEMKRLMLDHAFERGYHKVEFRVDTRNKRSVAAVLKLGAQQEGVLRKNRITWTGYVRDTAVFGLLREEWEE